MAESTAQQWVAADEGAGERLDTTLAGLAGISRSQARRWIDQGRVTLAGKQGRASQKVAVGDVIEADIPEVEPASVEPQAIALSVLYEDEHVIVVDKPAGMVVHPAPGHPSGTLVNALLHHCGDLAGIGGVLRPGIVHRLDRGTTGVIVAAKNDAAHQSLSLQFHDHTIEREYRALVRGLPGADEGRVDKAIGRHPRDRKRMSTQVRNGREAHSAWKVLERFPESERSWLAILPETGRTHQIRVHLASAGLPISGDPVYGRARRTVLSGRRRPPDAGLDRPALHAAVLGFVHPASGERMRFEAALPRDLEELLDRLRTLEAEA